jgi:hypothetical protein
MILIPRTLLLLLLLFVSSITCFPLFSNEFDKRIRSALIESLRRSYLDEKPLVDLENIPNICETRPAPSIKDDEHQILTFDIKYKLIIEFLNFKSLLNICKAYGSFRDSVVNIVTRWLFDFHPHFVTHDFAVNLLLFSMLKEHFGTCKNLQDPLIHDHLQLLTAKYFFGDLDRNVIPNIYYHYVICFLFEILYKTDQKTPVSQQQFLNLFVCSLRVREYSLLQSYNYIQSKYENNLLPEDYTNFEPNYGSRLSHLQFFYGKPSLDDIKTKFPLLDNYFERNSIRKFMPIIGFSAEFKLAILEAFLPEFTRQQVLEFRAIGDGNYYSFELAKVILANDELISQIVSDDLPFDGIFLIPDRYFYAVSAQRPNAPKNLIELVSKVSPTNGLNRDFQFKISMESLKSELASFTYSLSKTDAISDLISSNLDLDFYPRDIFQNIGNAAAIEIFCKERLSDSKYNLFARKVLLLLDVDGKFELISDKFAMHFFITLYEMKDPFVLLYFSFDQLKKSKNLIQDKFDLNLQYSSTDYEPSFDFNEFSIGYKMRQLEAFSFKKAINSFENEELKCIFSSNPEDFDDFSQISPIAISKFDNFVFCYLFDQESDSNDSGSEKIDVSNSEKIDVSNSENSDNSGSEKLDNSVSENIDHQKSNISMFSVNSHVLLTILLTFAVVFLMNSLQCCFL